MDARAAERLDEIGAFRRFGGQCDQFVERQIPFPFRQRGTVPFHDFL